MFQPINPIFLCEWLLLPLYPVVYTVGSAGTDILIFISCTNNFPHELVLRACVKLRFILFLLHRKGSWKCKKNTLA